MDKAQDHMRQLLVTLDADNETVAANVEAALESRRWVLRRDPSAPDSSFLGGAASANFASSASLADFRFGSNAQDTPGSYYENVKTKEKVFTKAALSRRWHAATLVEQTLNNGDWRFESSAASGNKYFRNTRTGEIIPTERQLEERLLMTDAVSKERDVYVQALEALADRRMPEYVMGLLRYARDTFQPYEVRLKALELLRSTIVIFPEPLQKGSDAEKKRNQLFLRWKECSLESRTGLKEDLLDLKEELLATLASPEPIVRDTVALLISTFASLELPEGQWPELFRTLYSAGAKDDDEIVSAVILTMKYIAQAISHTPQLAEAIITVGDNILDTFCKAMARAQPAVQINALETLYHCLPCLHGHMEEQQQRDYLLGVVCTAAADQMLIEGVREKAMACLVRIAYLYYHPQFLGRYKSDLIEITLRAIERRVDPSALEATATLGRPEVTMRSRGSHNLVSMQIQPQDPVESGPASPASASGADRDPASKAGSFSSSMDHSILVNAGATGAADVEDTDAVAVQALQFWSVICTTERDLREADGAPSSRPEQSSATGLASSTAFFGNQSSRTSMEFCTSAFNSWNKRQGLAYILFNAMLKQPDSPPADGSIPLSSAASKALLLLCQAVGDPIVGLLGARINSHMERVEWRSKEAACMALGCMLHGPNPAVVQTYVENRASQLLDLLGDSNDLVADTAGWCVALICDRFVDVFTKNHDVMQRLLNAVNPMFRRQAARALRAAQIIHNLSLQFEDDDDLYTGDNEDAVGGVGGGGYGGSGQRPQNEDHDYSGEMDLGRSTSSGDHRGSQSRGQRASGQAEQQNSMSQSISMAVGSTSAASSGNAKRTRNELFSLNYEIFISLLLGNTHREGGQLRFETQEAMNALICAAPRHAKARMALKDLMTELMNELESYLKLINETKSVPNPDWLKQVSLICTGLGHLSRKLGPFEENFAVRHPFRSFDLMMKTIKLGHPPITIEALLVIGLMIEAMGPAPFRLTTGTGAGSFATSGQSRSGMDRFGGGGAQQGFISGSNTLGGPLMRTDSNLSGRGVTLGGEQSVVPKQDVPEQLVNQLFDVLTDCLRAGFPNSKATSVLLHHGSGSPGVTGLAASPIHLLTPGNRQVEDSLCIAAITAVIDIANGWKEMFADRLDSILKELDLLLRDESVSREIQSVIIGTFGDLILATKESFSRSLPEVMALLGGPIEIRAQNMYIETQAKTDRRKWELTAEIHESLCNCYAAMLQGLKGRLGDLHPYIKHIVQFAAQVALKFPSGPVETQRAAISLIGIAAFVVSQDSTSHKGQFKVELQSHDVTMVLRTGQRSLNEAVNEAAQFALEEIASLGLLN